MNLNTALQKLGEQLLGAIEVPDVLERKSGRADFLKRIGREPELRTQIDEICEEFAETGKLAGGNKEVAYYVLDRFAEASHCGREMSPFAMMKGPWLEWLLVDYWHLAGCLRWRERLNYMSDD